MARRLVAFGSTVAASSSCCRRNGPLLPPPAKSSFDVRLSGRCSTTPDFARAYTDAGGTDLWGPGPYLKVPSRVAGDND